MTTQTNNYSFIYKELKEVANETPVQETVATEVKNVVPPTEPQWNLYLKMCGQKFVTPLEVTAFDKTTISKEIDRLMKYNPANKQQRDKIHEKVESLRNLVASLSFTEEQQQAFLNKEDDLVANIIGQLLTDTLNLEPIINKLEGGLNNSASKLISALIETEYLFTNQLPPTAPQVDMLVNMFLFADAEFEEYGIERRIDLGEGLWRKPTPEEFANNIIANMTKEEASKFIDKHRGGFYEWKQTRIRPEQFKHINRLQDKLCNDGKVAVVEQAVGLDGTVVDLAPNKNESIVGVAYVPLTMEQLAMMSITEASQFIEQLSKEVNDRPTSTLEDTLDTSNELRNVTDVNKQVEIEYKKFQDLMFSLEAVAGYKNDSVHEASTFNLVADDSPETNLENRAIIRDFMKELLSTGAITFLGLLQMCEDSVTAQRIILDM